MRRLQQPGRGGQLTDLHSGTEARLPDYPKDSPETDDPKRTEHNDRRSETRTTNDNAGSGSGKKALTAELELHTAGSRYIALGKY